jgi:prepilin-type N-terminal cleavage/methylation domain-containing protein
MNGTRSGFSMVEVLVAMVLLAVILTALAGFTFTTARRAITVTDASAREALLLESVNRFNSLPFDSLRTGCDTVGTVRNRFSRCATVTRSGNRSATVVVSVTPLQRGLPGSTARFVRPGNPQPSPLCVSGNC